MRTTARLLTSAAVAAATVGFGLGASGAYAEEPDGLEVFPSTAEPGANVTVNTNACGRNGHAMGDARSLGAGEFALAQGTHKEVVAGEFRIPRGAESGTYSVEARCRGGKRALGDAVVWHHKNEESSEQSGQKSNEQGGQESKEQGGQKSNEQGGQESKEQGGQKSNEQGGQESREEGRQESNEHGRHERSEHGRHEPSGHVRTGLGGSVGPDTTQIAAGVAVLAAAAVGGTLLLSRRARGDQGS
ncbi:hypothetical protein ACFYT4_00825 [Streptomyces sp. NPDC004609]|uniref:hypothetical protein n=1 Tax=Streptomyces sp. NPDC004609 TaxID=3364704 RepID=UPI0036A4BD63